MRQSIVFLAVLAAACGVSESVVEQHDGADVLDVDAELSTASRTYVGIRRDFRKCISPLCGGYWVHDLNRVNLSEVYVNSLDYSASGLSDVERGQVEGGLEEVVLRGKLGPKEAQFGTRPFIVSEAYRGMPGKQFDGEQFFKVKPVNIQCFRAPCPSLGATRVNYAAQTLFHGFDVAYVGEGRVDANWLTGRALHHGAIVVGTWYRKGEERLLDVANVFVRLPEQRDGCPQYKLAQCPEGQVHSFTRDADRCVLPSGCITPGGCALYLPTCNEGYTLQSWTSAPFACNAYVCDPSWVLPAQE